MAEREIEKWVTVNGKHIPVYKDDGKIEKANKQYEDKDSLSFLDEDPKLEKAVERAFDKANLMGEDADIYKALYSYKIIRELDDDKIELLYDYLADRLGF